MLTYPNDTSHFSEAERTCLESLDTPRRIQDYLDEIAYAGEPINRSPRRVIQERKAHCLDGGLLAALALRRLGFPPLIVDVLPDPGRDDDHILAIFKANSCWGAIAKSNYVGLRYRDPVYRSLRELIMSYFEVFFSINGEKTLRTYTRPLNLKIFDPLGWPWNDVAADAIEQHLKRRKTIPLLNPEQIASLEFVDARSYKAGMLGTNLEGVFRPEPKT